MRLIHVVLALVATVSLSACGGSDRDITMRLLEAPGDGPDEFGVLPGKPLEAPSDYAELPTPTPGQTSLTDRSPRAEGIAALGGNPARLTPAGVPNSDSALVRHASRNGTNPNVRAELAAEDEKFRTRKSRFTKIRIVKTDRYAQAYKRQTLDAYKEWYRFRRTGVRTPTAPPTGE
ncbi:DUF3035 domain-containing protein [Lentibacter algarum]|uniref:DUF3035 domain-containing protein n=1 Tax=Lentibacter algarum TaxID=576131 RepID=UPI001C07EB43|nr:DUF3035 domain-containing protein [Lentibacter algarum]MBU2980514.1 DUF3035 domain-containing protein [Lentibacter algarum]